jgi:hypothetical protein
VDILGESGTEPWIETLLWRNGDRYCLAVLKNLTPSANEQPKTITVRINLPVRGLRNSRTGKVFGNVTSFTDEFNPWEANLYEFAIGKQ